MRNWQTVTNTETVRFTSHEPGATEWWMLTFWQAGEEVSDNGVQSFAIAHDTWELTHVGETGEVNDNGNARYRFTSHGFHSCWQADDVIDAIERGANQ